MTRSIRSAGKHSHVPTRSFNWKVLDPDEVRELPLYYGKPYRKILMELASKEGVQVPAALKQFIHAHCRRHKITGYTLKQKISAMAKRGHISGEVAKKIKAFWKPGSDTNKFGSLSSAQIKIVLEVINHRLRTCVLYVDM